MSTFEEKEEKKQSENRNQFILTINTKYHEAILMLDTKGTSLIETITEMFTFQAGSRHVSQTVNLFYNILQMGLG